jgi:hypothetical protein
MSVKSNIGVVTDGLVFYVDAGNDLSYPGSGGTWSDLVGGNNGSFNSMDDINNPSNNYDSGSGGSIVFDGVDDYVRISNTSTDVFSFDNISATFTIWVKPDSIDTMILVKRNNSFGWEIQLDGNGFISWYFQSSGGTFFDQADGTAVSTGQWNHITVVLNRDTNIVSRYLNATPTGTNTSINGLTSLTDNSTDVSIGGRYARNDKYFNGNIGPTCIYNRALSASEILQNYNALKNRFV